ESNSQDNNDDNNEGLPCRIICHFDGAEWFMYNCTPAYDALKNIISRVNDTEMSSDRLSTSSIILNEPDEIAVNIDESDHAAANKSKDSFFRKLLPIQLEVERSAVICGSASTPSVLIAEFCQASGIYTAVKSRSVFDYYKLVLDLEFREPKIYLKPNPDYVEAFRDTVVRQNEDKTSQRKCTDKEEGKAGVINEYAKVTTILSCPLLNMNYYADVAGKVPKESISTKNPEEIDIGNGDLSPEWGIDLIFTNAQDWKFHHDDDASEHNRQYGWLEFKILDEQNKSNDSTVNITLPMIYTEKGYTNNLEIDLENIEVQTSVNFSKVLTTKKVKIMCDLPAPLKWNKIRRWEFDVYLTDAKIFLLRDHITLFQDLIKDWTDGPSPDQLHFIPMEYHFKPRFTTFELYLYANEQNIIDDPIDIDDN
ncbi:14597_t:CDS:2, partial [Acaulospora colombiana]